MTETAEASDMSKGLVLAFGVITVLASIAVATSAYLSAAGDNGDMQLLSGVFMTVALLAAGIAVAAVHLY